VLRAFSRKAGGLSNGQLAKQTRLAPSTGEVFDALEHPNTAGIGRTGRRIFRTATWVMPAPSHPRR
jgi:hypothetical protein